jgi:hypothetical protein
MLNTELDEALKFVQQKYGLNPDSMSMNRHTLKELMQISIPCKAEIVEEGQNFTWADIPVKLDEKMADHDIAFDMPEPINLEESINEPSLSVESV